MDLYPEALFAAGRVARDGLAGQLLRFVNELGIRRVDLVVSLSVLQLATVEGYSAFTDLHRSTVIPPWDVRRNQRVQEDENRLAHEMSWVGKRIVLYAGNLGEAHDVTDLVAAARLLRERGDQTWRFVFAVRGSRTGTLIRAAEDLPNVEIHDYFPPDRTEELLSAADVHVVSIRPEWASVLVPSKLYGAAATGSPVLFLGAPSELVDDECRSVVLTACSGTNPSDLVDMLEELHGTKRRGHSKIPDQRRHRDKLVDLLIAPAERATAQ
jgi:glycosyltransferase involved in cell wall biosynthesis